MKFILRDGEIKKFRLKMVSERVGMDFFTSLSLSRSSIMLQRMADGRPIASVSRIPNAFWEFNMLNF